VLFASDEDLDGGGGDPAAELERWVADVPIVAVTASARGARIYADGHWRSMTAFPEPEVDATGAGDTFAAAFLIRLHESGDVQQAARFGAAAASISVAGRGVAAMPERDEIEARMRAHPEVMLR
jgi:sugar/nucleoside kinase (ribokinase family)